MYGYEHRSSDDNINDKTSSNCLRLQHILKESTNDLLATGVLSHDDLTKEHFESYMGVYISDFAISAPGSQDVGEYLQDHAELGLAYGEQYWLKKLLKNAVPQTSIDVIKDYYNL